MVVVVVVVVLVVVVVVVVVVGGVLLMYLSNRGVSQHMGISKQDVATFPLSPSIPSRSCWMMPSERGSSPLSRLSQLPKSLASKSLAAQERQLPGHV
jgi:hypothetical protein